MIYCKCLFGEKLCTYTKVIYFFFLPVHLPSSVPQYFSLENRFYQMHLGRDSMWGEENGCRRQNMALEALRILRSHHLPGNRV